ncbi:hypothetical protein M407DRAFT_30814 [Tulasnella calospora MUT 4182]|uniref:Uncharacterized protein n=1 Tax=Tulasnella calospora MUT 4182 TaxID=1051891 RepID=A0A0C3KDL8_9AGAM|nr:hypothetical protein M407DRAFT_30814 [Tulasnella calospora MUT 4182]
MSNPNPNPDNNTPPGTPPNPSASEGTEINPTPLLQLQMSAATDDIDQLLAVFGSGWSADAFIVSAATPSAPTTSPTVNVLTGPSGAMTGPLQANLVSSASASTSLRTTTSPDYLGSLFDSFFLPRSAQGVVQERFGPAPLGHPLQVHEPNN